jgi:hypothetical protein
MGAIVIISRSIAQNGQSYCRHAISDMPFINVLGKKMALKESFAHIEENLALYESQEPTTFIYRSSRDLSLFADLVPNLG